MLRRGPCAIRVLRHGGMDQRMVETGEDMDDGLTAQHGLSR